jgi:hypothetical protein
MMELFRFRLARPDGTVAVERQEIADSLSQAVAAAFAIARQVKREQSPACERDTWVVDIVDSGGDWMLSVPLAMVSS